MFKGARGQSGCTRFGAPILPKDGETHLGRRWVCTPVLDYTHFVRTLVCGAFQMKSKVAPIFLHLSLLEMGAQLYFNLIAQRAVRRAWTQAQHEQMEKRKSTNRKWKSWAEARIKIARMNLKIKPGRNWSIFQLANSAPPLSVTDVERRTSTRQNRTTKERQRPQNGTHEANIDPKRVVNGSRSGQKWPQDGPKRVPKRSQTASRKKNRTKTTI